MTLSQLRQLLLLQARTDAPDVVSYSDVWVNLSILRICREQPPQGWWFTRRTVVVPADLAGNAVLPDVPIQVRSVQVGTTVLEKIDPLSSYLFSGSTVPIAYYVDGSTVVIVPPAVTGSLVKVIYDRKLPDLVNDQDENELTIIAPEVVVYGAMVDVSLHLGRVEDSKVWEERFQRGLDDLRRLNLRRREAYLGDVLSDARPT